MPAVPAKRGEQAMLPGDSAMPMIAVAESPGSLAVWPGRRWAGPERLAVRALDVLLETDRAIRIGRAKAE